MADLDAISGELLAILNTGRQVAPYSKRYPDFNLADAYRITDIVRRAREAKGERYIGRKIGFTNRTIWEEYKVYAPIWGFVYDAPRLNGPAGAVFTASMAAEPRIEPEIIFWLSSAPSPDMDERGLLDCISYVGHGFEIVQSIFPNWEFSAADTVAAYGLHRVLFTGPMWPVKGQEKLWLDRLATFEIDLYRDGTHMDHGLARNVLDGPLSALRHLVKLLADDPINPPLAAGELVTTGTLTRAFPIEARQHWWTRLSWEKDKLPTEIFIS